MGARLIPAFATKEGDLGVLDTENLFGGNLTLAYQPRMRSPGPTEARFLSPRWCKRARCPHSYLHVWTDLRSWTRWATSLNGIMIRQLVEPSSQSPRHAPSSPCWSHQSLDSPCQPVATLMGMSPRPPSSLASIGLRAPANLVSQVTAWMFVL